MIKSKIIGFLIVLGIFSSQTKALRTQDRSREFGMSEQNLEAQGELRDEDTVLMENGDADNHGTEDQALSTLLAQHEESGADQEHEGLELQDLQLNESTDDVSEMSFDGDEDGLALENAKFPSSYIILYYNLKSYQVHITRRSMYIIDGRTKFRVEIKKNTFRLSYRGKYFYMFPTARLQQKDKMSQFPIHIESNRMYVFENGRDGRKYFIGANRSKLTFNCQRTRSRRSCRRYRK